VFFGFAGGVSLAPWDTFFGSVLKSFAGVLFHFLEVFFLGSPCRGRVVGHAKTCSYLSDTKEIHGGTCICPAFRSTVLMCFRRVFLWSYCVLRVPLHSIWSRLFLLRLSLGPFASSSLDSGHRGTIIRHGLSFVSIQNGLHRTKKQATTTLPHLSTLESPRHMLRATVLVRRSVLWFREAASAPRPVCT
jgi:hypothetical protein